MVMIVILLLAGYTIWRPYSGFAGKTAWHWLNLVGISSAIALVGWIVTRKQRERDEAVALEQAQDGALRAYLDQMSNLMIDQKLLTQRNGSNGDTRTKMLNRARTSVATLLGVVQEEEPENPSVRGVAQARTIAILLGLDGEHKRRPLKLVYELGLIHRHDSVIELKNAGLDHANLSELTLRGANLRCVDLRATDLSGSDLSGSDLWLADLRGADLRGADLKDADLTNTNFLAYDEWHPERWSLHNLSRIDPSKEKLRHHTLTPKPFRRLTPTNLSGATLVGACLRDAVLVGADLSNADLTGADLRGANLKKANLRGTIITREQLAACESFEGATMPDGARRSRQG
jgi:uncharacterized protein YjbI with pentapeptide repeats